MFDRLFRRAERKIDSVVAKYVRRTLVAVPLVIAALFATAAVAVKLVEVYGAVNGYAIMAAGFAALAAVVALFALTGRQTPVEEAEAASAQDADKLKEDDDAPLVPPELASLLAAAAPVALPGVARAAARNLPLLVLLAIVGYLIARYSGRNAPPDTSSDVTDQPESEPAPADDAATEARAAEAAATMAARAAAA